MMSRTATFTLTLVVAFAVAAALVFTSPHSFSTMPAAAEILGRGIALFAMGWAVAGIAYLVSGRRLQRKTPSLHCGNRRYGVCRPHEAGGLLATRHSL